MISSNIMYVYTCKEQCVMASTEQCVMTSIDIAMHSCMYITWLCKRESLNIKFYILICLFEVYYLHVCVCMCVCPGFSIHLPSQTEAN